MSEEKEIDVSHIKGGYLFSVIDLKARRIVLKKLIEAIKPIKDTFDTIAFKGMSGSLIAPILADKLKKEIVFVRSSSIDSHARYENFQGHKNIENYIIIDDCIDSGKTIGEIVDGLESCTGEKKLLHIFLYNSERDSDFRIKDMPIPVKGFRLRNLKY